jgi:two-component system catabolic regulation response regulator CreB
MAANILVVEDEPAICDSLVYVLATEGFVVRTAATLQAARAALTTELQLIVLDVGLPDGNGFDFCRELRRSSHVPVLFLTARADEIDRVVGLEIGADDYVTKPFSPREVAARVKAILRRAALTATATPSTSPLSIDLTRKIALLDGQPLDLSKQELRLLTVLAEQPGRVFSRAQLLDLAWDDPSAAFDRIIDSHIKSLRAALRRIRPEIDAITTVRGEGYALIERWP